MMGAQRGAVDLGDLEWEVKTWLDTGTYANAWIATTVMAWVKA